MNTLELRADLAPKGAQGDLVRYGDFDAWFNADAARYNLVMGVLTAPMTVKAVYRNGQERSLSGFSADPSVRGCPPGSAYDGLLGTDGAHGWPAVNALYDKSLKALVATNYTTNILPSPSAFNRGVDRELEGKLFKRAALKSPIAIFKGAGRESLGRTSSQIDIPASIFKLAVELKSGKYCAWWLANAEHPASLDAARISVAQIEHLTGLKFPCATEYDGNFIDCSNSRDVVPNYIARCRAAGLKAPAAFWQASEELVASIYNGAGPDSFPEAVNLLFRVICLTDADGANEDARAFLTFMLRIFELAFVIHDFRYQFSDRSRSGFELANQEMLDNMDILLNAAYPMWQFWWHFERAYWWTKMELAYQAVSSESGWEAWIADHSGDGALITQTATA